MHQYLEKKRLDKEAKNKLSLPKKVVDNRKPMSKKETMMLEASKEYFEVQG